MDGFPCPSGFATRRESQPQDLPLGAGAVREMDKLPQQMVSLRGPPTPSMGIATASFEPPHDPQQKINGSPPSPPTPAASPGPTRPFTQWAVGYPQEAALADSIQHFRQCDARERTKILTQFLLLCTPQQLSFVHQFVNPRLKRDPFSCLPDELCLRVLSFVDDPLVLARASQVSKRWHTLLGDDMTWKHLCVKHDYDRRLSETIIPPERTSSSSPNSSIAPSAPSREDARSQHTGSPDDGTVSTESSSRQDTSGSYRFHFKRRYLIDAAWRSGGVSVSKSITQAPSVVTSLHLTPKYIIVALDDAKIHVFDTEGNSISTLHGHVVGVWAMVPWDDVLVSGGCDRDVRVWDLASGVCTHVLRGHTSTVRCLKMCDPHTAVSGSRDTTLRIWDVHSGHCENVLVGHQASVRCLEIKGDIVVSGSYDTTAKIWSISEGRCLRTLSGHFSQIYAVAFDGERIATGSLDTSVRIWDAQTGEHLAILQGHTSLVGQLQMRGDTLVTGGSDGSVRVWSMDKFVPIHRLAAHDNSVTSLQYDDTRIVSGGSDGRVKVWDIKTGNLVRELIPPAEAVWRVAFEHEKCVAMALRRGKTYLEVWSFSPPEDKLYERPWSAPRMSTPHLANASDSADIIMGEASTVSSSKQTFFDED